MVAKRIYEYILDHYIKQTELARKIGMSKQCFNNKLQGRSAITIEEYIAICHALGVPLDTFDTTENNVAAR